LTIRRQFIVKVLTGNTCAGLGKGFLRKGAPNRQKDDEAKSVYFIDGFHGSA
jgi:hypothetical protein